MKPQTHWTPTERQKLKDLYLAGLTPEELEAAFPGRTWHAIRKKIKRENLVARKTDVETKKKGEYDYDEFAESIIKEAYKSSPRIIGPKKEDVFTGTVEEDAILLLSDIHVGKKNTFINLTTSESVLTYNTNIMWEQANKLLESIMSINVLLSGHYKLRKLYIFGLGDLLDNDMILRGQKFFIDAGVGEQVKTGVKLFRELLNEFLKTFEEIEFIVIGGNHGRMTARREPAPYYNNFDHLMGYALSIAYEQEPRVTITLPQSWFHLQTIHGWKYLLHHGNSVYSWMSIPYYGLQRAGKARRVEIPVDIECIGHFHTRMEIPVSSRSHTLVNGGWVPYDNYSWEKFGALSKPEQVYFGVSPKRPRTWSFNLEIGKDLPSVNHEWATANRSQEISNES